MNAFSCIGPAFERMVQTCFRPFRFSVWAQLALVVLLAGETIGGGGVGNGGNFGRQRDGGNGDFKFPHISLSHSEIVLLVSLGVAILLGFILLFAYLNARARFVLMDAVVERTCRLGEMWEKWRAHAQGYFAFALLMIFAIMALVCAVVLTVLRAVMRHSGPAGAINMVLLILLLSVVFGLVWLFAKDFVVPIMAFESLPIGVAWQRLRDIISAEPGAFVLYVIARMILTVGCAVVLFIVALPVMLIVIIPLAIVFGIMAVIAKGSLAALSVVIALGILVVIPLVLFVAAFLNVPFGVFFEAFALEFISYRLPSLAAALHPLPPVVPTPIAPIPPTIPPEPSPI